MNSEVLRLLIHLASHAATHLAKHKSSGASSRCANCGTGLEPSRTAQFTCCNSLLCFGCAGTMLEPAGGGSFHVSCGMCGSKRITKPWR